MQDMDSVTVCALSAARVSEHADDNIRAQPCVSGCKGCRSWSPIRNGGLCSPSDRPGEAGKKWMEKEKKKTIARRKLMSFHIGNPQVAAIA
ncbi:hypothetical protein BaRGS_00036743 [Batillaria attramentaria]|uniref:Uncharacterized protein n=1 Tax=Batillaria attramentaria TaxID=370345 RepID=A0ABD0JAW4_9CAEN